MSEWTKAAEQEWNNYCGRVRAGLGTDPADADEVVDDLRRHLEEEITATRLVIVTEEDIRRITLKMGVPEKGPALAAANPPAPPPANTAPKRAGWFVSALVLLGGVLLPLFTLGFELATSSCGAAFFDPIPTPFHVLLVAFVPGVNLWTWMSLRGSMAVRLGNLGWLNAAAIAITLFFTLQFLPMLPWGFVGIMFMGFGFLPLAPFLSLLATLVLRVKLNTFAEFKSVPLMGFWRGFGLAALLLLALGAQTWVTRLGITWAASEDRAQRSQGVHWLRAIGNEEMLLRECYGRTARSGNMDLFDLLLSGRSLSADEARLMYYRVTGRAFNTVPAPNVRTARGAFADLDNWTWDADQGGEAVGGRIKGLTLHGSRLDAVIEPDAAYAYSEWTLEFKNAAAQAHEARAQVLLPPGGVVSRLTLWVNGEEREAAFGGRAQVKQAYKSVAIVQRRDPVLVSTCGPDRILVQCFPVPANGGTIKVRLGITSPLLLPDPAQGVFRWPCFIERNFSIPEESRHAVWATSSQPMSSSPSLVSHSGGNSPHALHGELREGELASTASLIRVVRTSPSTAATARDSRGATSAIIRQVVELEKPTPPGRAILVLDRSPNMAGPLAELARTIEALSTNIDWGVVVVGDEVQWLLQSTNTLPNNSLKDVARRIRQLNCVGGYDNVPALATAFDWASAKPNSAVIWVHAPQPVELSSVEPLRQRLERDTQGTRILSLQASVGPNRILELLDGLTAVTSAARFGAFTDDLKQALLTCQQGSSLPALHRERDETAAGGSGEIAGGSLHLARLWANDEVRRLMAKRQIKEAVALAARYQLVTPVTAAVVLETQQQFQQHGLEPVDPATVPSIPEPSAFSLMLMASVLVQWLRSRKSRLAKQ